MVQRNKTTKERRNQTNKKKHKNRITKMSQYVELDNQEDINAEAFKEMKRMYARKDYATVQHKWTVKGVVPACEHKPVEAEETMFDVEGQWNKMSPEQKAVVRDSIASGASNYHKEVVKYVHTDPLAKGEQTLHERESDRYLQAVVELFAEENKSWL